MNRRKSSRIKELIPMDAPVKKKASHGRSFNWGLVTHIDPRTDPLEAAFNGAVEFSDRHHSRFQRGDVLIHVRPESRLLNLFRAPVFQNAELRDISVSGASFQAVSPIRVRRVSLRIRFADGVEFMLPARVLKRHRQNLHRVQFLERNQAFVDHLLKSSLNLRFQDLG